MISDALSAILITQLVPRARLSSSLQLSGQYDRHVPSAVSGSARIDDGTASRRTRTLTQRNRPCDTSFQRA